MVKQAICLVLVFATFYISRPTKNDNQTSPCMCGALLKSISHVINRRLRASYQAHKPARIVTGNLCELLSRESLMLILLKELDVCLTKEMSLSDIYTTERAYVYRQVK